MIFHYIIFNKQDQIEDMQLIEKLVDYSLLNKSWKSVYKGKSEDKRLRSRGADNVTLERFKSNKDDEIEKLISEIINKNYRRENLYGFAVPKKKKNKYRLVTAPSVRDRVVERAILELVKPYLLPYANSEVSYCGTSDLLGRKRNIKRVFSKIIKLLKEKKFIIFESDIESFFDEIPKQMLFKLVKKHLPDKSLNNLIKEIIFFKVDNMEELKRNLKISNFPKEDKGISQGSILSPLFANLYLNKFDSQLGKKFGNRLIRYVDDFIFLSSSESEVYKFYDQSKKILNRLKLSIPPLDNDSIESKTKLFNIQESPHSCIFLGVKINRKGMWPKFSDKEIIFKFNDDYLNYKHKKYKGLSYSMTRNRMNERIKGFSNYYKPFHSQDLFSKLNDLIDSKRKIKRFENLITLPRSTQGQLMELDEWRSLFT